MTVGPTACASGFRAERGGISADTLAAYPPGIPNVLPGESLTRETIAF